VAFRTTGVRVQLEGGTLDWARAKRSLIPAAHWRRGGGEEERRGQQERRGEEERRGQQERRGEEEQRRGEEEERRGGDTNYIVFSFIEYIM